MPAPNPRALIDKLSPTCKRALEGAAGLCLSRTNFHVEVEHWLCKLVEATGHDIPPIFRQYGVDLARVKRELDNALASSRRATAALRTCRSKSST
jgi:type VI secretion system protein VasG